MSADSNVKIAQPDASGAGSARVLERARLWDLMRALVRRGYKLLAAQERDGSLIYAELRAEQDLPIGLRDVQSGGRYRLEPRGDERVFGYSHGSGSLKSHFHVPREPLARLRRSRDGFECEAIAPEAPALALIGARSCELHAMAIQDRVLRDGQFADPRYAARRRDVFVVAVNCGHPGGTCFCVSMSTGPEVNADYDLLLTELYDAAGHRFLVECGSDAGRALCGELETRDASPDDLAARQAEIERARANMGRSLDTTGIKELLYGAVEHPRWDDVAARCLTCANCTSVCPTCFCGSVEDTTDLSGEHTERTRRWDSCFNLEFSYMHGGPLRASAKSRYRQWLTHKLASWIDQFDSSGCVGCGRCITWCPVAIDLTEEVAALREPAE